MIFQKDVHALNDPYFQPVKVDDDEIVFRQGTLIVACKLGEQRPESDVNVSVLFCYTSLQKSKQGLCGNKNSSNLVLTVVQSIIFSFITF